MAERNGGNADSKEKGTIRSIKELKNEQKSENLALERLCNILYFFNCKKSFSCGAADRGAED